MNIVLFAWKRSGEEEEDDAEEAAEEDGMGWSARPEV
jgi:hypothetical protein